MDRGVTDGAARPIQRRHGASRDRLRHVTLRWSTLVNTTSWSSFETKICATRMIRAIAKFIDFTGIPVPAPPGVFLPVPVYETHEKMSPPRRW